MVKLFTIFFIPTIILGSLSLLVLMLNTIHSLLLLLEIFIIGSLILFLFKVEFLALVFLMIYLGAILVLFLFVVMMLDIKTTAVQNDDINGFFFKSLGLWFFLPCFIWWFFSDFINFSLLLENADIGSSLLNFSFLTVLNFYSLILPLSNLEILGLYIFDFQSFSFLLAGLILYIAMIGAIVVSVETQMNYNQKLQNALVQGMRQGNILSYTTSNVQRWHWTLMPRWHWIIPHFPKPKEFIWNWLSFNSKLEKKH